MAEENNNGGMLLVDPTKEWVWSKYGEEPNAASIQNDFEASKNPLAFVRQVDVNGMNFLHYFGAQDVDNEWETAPLVERFLQVDPKLAQALDCDGQLPLYHYGEHITDNGDNWRSFQESISENPPDQTHLEGLGLVLKAFPEGLFATDFLDVMRANQRFQGSILHRLNNNTEQQEAQDDAYEAENCNANTLIGLLRYTFPDGFHQRPTPESVLQTGNRDPFHIICSYAYEPVFSSLFDVFFLPEKASLPDVAAHGILPLHLVLKSPILPHPLVGPIYGFHQMKQQNKSVPLQVVQRLVEAHPEALETPDENGSLPIHLAVPHNNNLELIQYLIQVRPATVTALDGQGRSPLRIACQRNCDLNLIYFLVGANPTQWRMRGTLPNTTTREATTTFVVLPPKVAPMTNQQVATNDDPMELVATLESGSQPVTWSLAVVSAFVVEKDPHGNRHLSPMDVAYCNVKIRKTTGTITLCPYHVGQITRICVTAENAAGWSNTEFDIETKMAE